MVKIRKRAGQQYEAIQVVACVPQISMLIGKRIAKRPTHSTNKEREETNDNMGVARYMEPASQQTEPPQWKNG